MTRLVPAGLVLVAALLAGCGSSGGTSDGPRPAGLTIGVGGSVGSAGAMVSQPRTDATRPR